MWSAGILRRPYRAARASPRRAVAGSERTPHSARTVPLEIVSVVAFHAVEPGEFPALSAQDPQLIAQFPQPLYAVPQQGGVFEHPALRGRAHPALETTQRRVVRALQEGPCRGHAGAVSGLSASARARRQAPVELRPDAFGVDGERKKLRLVAEPDGRGRRAVAQREHVRQLPETATDGVAAAQRAVVAGAVRDDAGGHDKSRRGPRRDLDEGVPGVAPVLHVVGRLLVANQSHLVEQGGELVRQRLPIDALGTTEDLRGLLARPGAEIREKTGPEADRLADVQHRAVAIHHAIDARSILRAFPDRCAEPSQAACVGCGRSRVVKQTRSLDVQRGRPPPRLSHRWQAGQ